MELRQRLAATGEPVVAPILNALRDNKLPGLDRVGVRVIFTHSWLTSFLPLPDGPWTDDSVFQLEPAQGMGS